MPFHARNSFCSRLTSAISLNAQVQFHAKYLLIGSQSDREFTLTYAIFYWTSMFDLYWTILVSFFCFLQVYGPSRRPHASSITYMWLIDQAWSQDIYLINQARGPYWENIGPGSWQYRPSASVQKWLRADILPARSPASLVNKRFITLLRKAKTQVQDHSGQCPVQYLENIGPVIEHFDWLI